LLLPLLQRSGRSGSVPCALLACCKMRQPASEAPVMSSTPAEAKQKQLSGRSGTCAPVRALRAK
jgi:hypothetical protein